MKVSLEQATGPSIDLATNLTARITKTKVTAQSVVPTSAEKVSSTASIAKVVPGPPETEVTFRRDQTGRIFYVVTDAKSGKELQEIPPQQVRSVGQGIEEYLQKAAKDSQTAHVEEKA